MTTICFFFFSFLFFLFPQPLNRRVHRFFVRVSSDSTRNDVPAATNNSTHQVSKSKNRGRDANDVVRRNMNRPAVVDVVARIAVVGEASADAELRGEFPHGVGQRTADAGDPTGSKLHRHPAETLLADPAADAIRRLQNHQVLDAVLSQHLGRSDTFKSKQTQ